MDTSTSPFLKVFWFSFMTLSVCNFFFLSINPALYQRLYLALCYFLSTNSGLGSQQAFIKYLWKIVQLVPNWDTAKESILPQITQHIDVRSVPKYPIPSPRSMP